MVATPLAGLKDQRQWALCFGEGQASELGLYGLGIAAINPR